MTQRRGYGSARRESLLVASYTATKVAVRLFTKSTAVQHAKDNIRCNSVHPGPIQTAMLDEAWDPVLPQYLYPAEKTGQSSPFNLLGLAPITACHCVCVTG